MRDKNIPRDMEDILTLLSIAIFADKRVFLSEIQIFTRSVSSLKLSHLDFSTVTEARALNWFELNRDNLEQKFSLPTGQFEAWLCPILARIRNHADIGALKYLMQLIFEADGEVHISEKALLALLEREWSLTHGNGSSA